MEQMYMIEIFINKISVFAEDQDAADKSLTAVIKFGPHTEFIMKEGELSQETTIPKVETNESGRRMVTSIFRVGKAYLFPSYPDTVVQILDRYPLEISVWNDDEENEAREFIGTGSMFWDTEFYNMLRVTADTCKVHKPLAIKQVTPIMDECCCAQVGIVNYIVRLTALGGSIMTNFQEMPKHPNSYIFSTDKNEGVYECKIIEGLDEPEKIVNKNASEKTVKICTPNADELCSKEKAQTKRFITKIKMGDIKGPCGNVNCTLAQKIKRYLRTTEAYKKKALRREDSEKKAKGIVCGKCDCHKERWYKEKLLDNKKSKSDVTICKGCGKFAKDGFSCEKQLNDTSTKSESSPYEGDMTAALAKESLKKFDSGKIDKDCLCDPPRPKPLCGAYDCVCREEVENKVTRRQHKPFCPSYKHKHTCPVSTLKHATEKDAEEKDDEEKEEDLPYGLPPITLGPCPVIGKPCTTEGFAKIVAKSITSGTRVKKMAPLGRDKSPERISCSKEFERIKAFLTDYMKEEGYIPDNRCNNPLNVNPDDLRCCDNDQRASKLDGKDCCGFHKEKGIPK